MTIGIGGLVPIGVTRKFAAFSDAERHGIIQVLCDQDTQRVPVVPLNYAVPTSNTLASRWRAGELNDLAVMLRVPASVRAHRQYHRFPIELPQL